MGALIETSTKLFYSIYIYIYIYINIYIYMWFVKKATESALPLGELDIHTVVFLLNIYL